MYNEKSALHQRQKGHRMGQLRTVSVDVTPKCNMSCPHCYAETFRNSTAVDLKVMVAALKEFHDLGVFHWVLQGGEPIVDATRLEAILLGCYPDESYITVVSNGWEMTKDRIHWLKQLKVDKIAFSMDSGIPHEHNATRLPGSFEKVCNAVDNVLAAGLFTSVSITVTRTSLYTQGFKSALEFAKSRKIRVDIQIAEPVGKWDGKKDLLIRPEDAAHLKKMQMELPTLPNGQSAIHRDIFAGNRDHCPAGTEFMAISSDGNVLPCNFLQYTLGKIGELSIKQMRDAIISSQWFDGKRPNCILGEDNTFIDSFIMPHKDKPKPINAYTVFDINQPRG
jgi:MoaA/NifB/PqqE/SkfB family radical SAM enzyme